MGGDFNCALRPERDRYARLPTATKRNESPALAPLTKTLQLQDALEVVQVVGESDTRPPSEHFTFWRASQASRIDRFYVATDLCPLVQWEETKLPRRHSDHQAVVLTLSDTRSRAAIRPASQHLQLRYPLSSSRPELILSKIRDALARLQEDGEPPDNVTWDEFLQRAVTLIKAIKTVERRQVKKYMKRLAAQDSTPKTTRSGYVTAAVEEQASKDEHRLGMYLLSTHSDVRFFFKRVSNWSRDQTISKLVPANGKSYSPCASKANIMAGEWQHIFGRIHSRLTEAQRERLFDKRLTIPVDCETELVPTLTSLVNQLLQGADMPLSFATSLIIPLQKKGDSPNAMDYRPISLLQSSYKIFAKIIAERVQAGLHGMIGDTQQGFVHSRLLERSVVLMQAMLQRAYSDETQSVDEAAMIVLLDFMNAYDSLDRNFILLVLRKFGFSPEFVLLVDKMHQQTTAQNTAFVDNSAVFMRNGAELPHLLRLLHDFEVVPGLKVQQQKSVTICLIKCIQQKAHCGIPLLPTGGTTRYLGIQIWTEDCSKANWDARLRSIQIRLTMAARVSNSIMGKVKILNAIMMPAVLFTAQFVRPPEAVVTKLVNLQKQFLWHGRLGTDGTKHKIKPELLFSPVVRGGVGLQAIPLAIKHQAMRRATNWLLAERSVFTEAWHSRYMRRLDQ